MCGMKNSSGKECVLPVGHDLDRPWQYREHETADGATFTYTAERGKASRQFSGPSVQNLAPLTW